MQYKRDKLLFAVVLVVALHALVLTLAVDYQFKFKGKSDTLKA